MVLKDAIGAGKEMRDVGRTAEEGKEE